MEYLHFFAILVLWIAIAAGQMQMPPDQQQHPDQQQFGAPQQQQGNFLDPRQQQQQQQFPGGVPGQQQQQFPGQFPPPGQQGAGGGFGGQPDQFGGSPLNPFQQQQQQQQQQGAGGPMPVVKITTDLFPVDRAQHADRLTWSEPRSDVVYCVSANPATSLQFYCYDCEYPMNTNTNANNNNNNNNNDPNAAAAAVAANFNNPTNADAIAAGRRFNELLRSETVNFQPMAGYPAIRLNSIPILGEELYMKTLSCVATYGVAPNGAPLNTSAASSLAIQFLSKPLIVDHQAHGPLYGGFVNPQDGYQFFVPQQSGFTLFCMARGNPPPVAYNWTVNGAPVPNAAASQLRVDAQTYAGKALACKAYSHAYPRGKESVAVGIMTWVPPMITGTNFQELQKQSGLYEQGSTNVQLGKRATMQCAVTGLPMPWIWWRQEISPGVLINASCDGGRQDSAPTYAQSVYSITSQCIVDVNAYDKTGRYWCSGCNYMSAGTYQCVPEERQVNSAHVKIDVIGAPLIPPDIAPFYEQLADSRSVRVGVPYCANPEPTNADGVYWLINGQRLNLRNHMENYEAEPPETNATVPNCWIARLRIRDVSEADRSKKFRLTVTNQMGSTFREFQLSQLNTTLPYGSNEGSIGLAVGLTLGFLLLLLLIGCAFCWWKKLLCFGKTGRRQPKQTQAPKQTKEKFPPSVLPDTVRIPAERLPEKGPGPMSITGGSGRPTYDLPPSEVITYDMTRPPRGFLVSKEVTV